MEDSHEYDVPRRGSRGHRGARGEPASVKALVRIAQRALRGQPWSSIEFHSGTDGNRVRVHRAMGARPAATPALREPPPAAVAMGPGKLSRKELKVLKYRRHGCLTQFFTTKCTVFAMRRLWARWQENITVAPMDLETAVSGWEDEEMPDAGEPPMRAPALPPASAPREPEDAAASWPWAPPEEAITPECAPTMSVRQITEHINKLSDTRKTTWKEIISAARIDIHRDKTKEGDDEA